ncbi:cobalt-precorrin-5B (C(1))-methyltransferase CbiD [Desulfobacterales bacterium HSG2]|nr:cobalt-precorrin-5B (C(1))-methyltransferase CbiD [Desulfobacterales bacterium HSG2]
MSSIEKNRLKTGFTTGAAAAAAAKGSLYLLLQGTAPKSVRIDFIGGGHREIDLHSCHRNGNKAICTVIKDAGDDPDVTHKAEIGACVEVSNASASEILITGGKGVGKVTKPGLEIPPGESAITSGPREMIKRAVNEVLSEIKPSAPCSEAGTGLSVYVEVFVPQGEHLAKRTLNSRLGIIGGISILGTTGIVRPMSHEAYIMTIRSALSVARACGLKRVFLTTGRRSERHAQQIWTDDQEEAYVQIGDFFKLSLELASEMEFETAVLTVFFGKAVKMAYGFPHTHAAKSDMCMKKLSHWAVQATGDPIIAQRILKANTARQAFFMLRNDHPEVIARVGMEMIRSAKKFIKGDIRIRSVILDFDGDIVFDSQYPNTFPRF